MSSQKLPTLVNLPNEIINCVAFYLSNDDLNECLCTSSCWNAMFRPFRYQKVKLVEQIAFKKFINTLEQSEAKTKQRKLRSKSTNIPRIKDLGDNVRTLDIKDGVMTINDMQKLARLCPHVTSVLLSWRVARNQDMERRSRSTRWFCSPVPFLEHFHSSNLVHIELNGSGKAGKIDMPVDLFKHTSQLESLIIKSEQFFITLSYLEQVHSRCPKIKHLKIITRLMVDDNSVPLHDIEHLEPSSAVQSVVLPEKQVWSARNVCRGPWLKYIIQKYPKLKSLDIGAVGNSHFESLQYQSQEGITNIDPDTALFAFRDYFPQLDELSICDFAGMPDTTWPLLMNRIRRVSLCGSIEPSFTTWSNDNATKDITHLSLSTLPSDLHGLRNCKYLQKLSLNTAMDPKSHTGAIEIFLDVILTCCTVLKTLEISGSIVCYNDEHAIMHQLRDSPLEYLMLEKSALTSNILKSIADHCPHIVHLEIIRCAWVVDRSNRPVIRLDFPHHQLSYFRLVSPWICTRLLPANSSARITQNQFPQRRYRTNTSPGLTDGFMLKTSKDREGKLLLFGIGPLSTNNEVTIMRVYSDEMMCYFLDDPEDVSKDKMKQMKAKRAIESLRYFQDAPQYHKYWCIVMVCNSVNLLYFNDGRMNLEKGYFCSTSKKYSRATSN